MVPSRDLRLQGIPSGPILGDRGFFLGRLSWVWYEPGKVTVLAGW